MMGELKMFKEIMKKTFKKGVSFDINKMLKEMEILSSEIKEQGIVENKQGEQIEFVTLKIYLK